jgi:hypothetical protein
MKFYLWPGPHDSTLESNNVYLYSFSFKGSAVFAEIGDSSTHIPNLQDLNFGNLPGNLSVPANLPVNISNVPTIEEGQRLFEEKCKKMGHPEVYETVLVCKRVLR